MKTIYTLAAAFIIFASCTNEQEPKPLNTETYNYWYPGCGCKEIVIKRQGAVQSVKQLDGSYKSYWFHAGYHTQDSLGAVYSHPIGTTNASEYDLIKEGECYN